MTDSIPKICLNCADAMQYFDGSTRCPHCDGSLVNKPLEIKVYDDDAKRIKKGQQFVASVGSVEGHTVVTLYEIESTKCADCGKEIDEATMTICSGCLKN